MSKLPALPNGYYWRYKTKYSIGYIQLVKARTWWADKVIAEEFAEAVSLFPNGLSAHRLQIAVDSLYGLEEVYNR